MTGTKNILTSLVEMFKSYHKRLEIKKNNNTWAIRKHLESGQEQGWAERTSACPGLPTPPPPSSHMPDTEGNRAFIK